MPLPDTRDGLVSLGYKYDGESHCRGCNAVMLWFITPNNKKMPFTVIPGTEHEDPQRLECHFGRCPNADRFRKPKAKKKIA